MNHQEFLEKYATQVADAAKSWKAFADESASVEDRTQHRDQYREQISELQHAYIKEGLFMDDLRSPNCRDGLNGNFHLILEAITGEKDKHYRPSKGIISR